ncbi:TM0106 family RecB-like putative nuclease [Mycolicibacterium sediminis]|uniref:ATPase n=1 Tax=Mycolicibacterium sediminis TaxID=1286180 RepID=A0A7I7QP18_9MYCO|nr:TM0106 family RecB-like putative nuclease [Mycolicibacterium sediminis]BBY28113.1 ATPase [Mycolicibacterium sediminis]
MRERLITPSKITAWLDCPHYLTLRNRVDDGNLAEPDPTFGSFAELLRKKGEAHEQDCLLEYKRLGKKVFSVPERRLGETFLAWVYRVGNPMADGWDVVYQMPFINDGVRGIADFLERVQDDDGTVSWEPVDAKLTRADAKPGHVLQLCFYADAITALTGVDPPDMHVLLGSGQRESLRVNEFRPYWRRLRTQLAAAVGAGPDASTTPKPCAHCDFCEFSARCDSQWREEDSLVYVPGIREPERVALADSGVNTLALLGRLRADLSGIRPERLHWLVRQAGLQVAAQLDPDAPPPFTMIESTHDPDHERGYGLLPRPDVGDVFLDFEGHPFWRADTGLFFLFGLIESDQDGQWAYRAWWAHDLAGEAAAVTALVDYFTHRLTRHPDMHVYHYNHTERSALQSLTRVRGVAEADLGRLVEADLFVDLLQVARNAIQVGTESYGLKYLEKLTGYERSHDIDEGAGAVVRYETFMTDHDQSDLDAIAAYNEDDVRATRAFRDWLITQRPPEMPWPTPREEPSPIITEISQQIAHWHAHPEGTPEHLLGDLLGYWTAEWWAYLMPKLVQAQQDTADLLEDREAITGLREVGLRPRIGAKGNELSDPALCFTFPPQRVDGFRHGDETVLYLLPNGSWHRAKIDRLEGDAGELDLQWGLKNQTLGHRPTSVVLHSWIPTETKRLALSDFATRLSEGRGVNPVTEALLARRLPRFLPGGGPPAGVFSDDVDNMVGWAGQLARGYVAVQGPPGTGKTYRAARMIHALVTSGRRVGVTAFSHRAIENLLFEVVNVFQEKGDFDQLRGLRSHPPSARKVPGMRRGDAADAAKPRFNLLAGTPWLFSNEKMRDAPVDVLLIDEAGQLALADALAASTSALNVILLGDPLQLPQVMQAVHPGGGGRSVLEHVLGDAVTLPRDRGSFLAQTRRMHPDICAFISAEIYEGKLDSHPNCGRQNTVAGTGLRWLPARHYGNATSSTEEAELIFAEIARLIGTPWVNFEGRENPLLIEDFMIVAPYNDQVRTIRNRLDADPRTAGIHVGTVDRFQGGEAAVVFFSMATSTGADMVRSADFLFSRNRLNVAVSRARCLAYLTCTEDLLNARARTVDDMRLVATLNAFVEYAQRPTPPRVGAQL